MVVGTLQHGISKLGTFGEGELRFPIAIVMMIMMVMMLLLLMMMMILISMPPLYDNFVYDMYQINRHIYELTTLHSTFI